MILALSASLIGLTPALAFAQTGTAEAEQLFRDGKRLMQEKKFAEACTAFETSYKLDAALTTRLNLADCREKNSQLATAWGLFVDAERETRGEAKHSALNKTASTRATALEARLSYLTISVADDSRIEGLTILRNGAVLDPGLWNRAVPVDGGAIVIAGSAPGHEEWSTTAKVPIEGAKVSVEVPRFKEIRVLVKPGQSEGELRRDGMPMRDSPPPGAFTGQRKIALGVAVAGVAILGIGGWMGTQARGYDRDAFELCPDPSVPCADAEEATALSDRASSRALYANVSIGVGAAAIIGATVLWFTGGPTEKPSSTAVAPTVLPGFAGLVVSGSF